jgi:DNA-binding NarL/FixJ family response regulator
MSRRGRRPNLTPAKRRFRPFAVPRSNRGDPLEAVGEVRPTAAIAAWECRGVIIPCLFTLALEAHSSQSQYKSARYISVYAMELFGCDPWAPSAEEVRALKGWEFLCMDRPITVMLVGNHPILLDGLRALVEGAEGLTLIGTEMSVLKSLEMARGIGPEVVVLDNCLLDMNGFFTLRQFASDQSGRGLVLLSAIEDHFYVRRALQAGVRAYVLKRSRSECLLHGIRAAASGAVYLDPVVAADLVVAGTQPHGRGGRGEPQLTPREAEVIRLIALGYRMKEIAGKLDVNPKSVETYKARGCEKLQLTSRAHIVRFAAANGWLANP